MLTLLDTGLASTAVEMALSERVERRVYDYVAAGSAPSPTVRRADTFTPPEDDPRASRTRTLPYGHAATYNLIQQVEALNRQLRIGRQGLSIFLFSSPEPETAIDAPHSEGTRHVPAAPEDTELLDWEARSPLPPPRRAGTVKVRLVYAGRVTIPAAEDPWA